MIGLQFHFKKEAYLENYETKYDQILPIILMEF